MIMQKLFNHLFVETISGLKNQESDLASLLKDSQKLSPSRAIAIYQEDYQARLTEALKNTYTMIHFFIGDEHFYQLALEFIQGHVSVYSNLDEYGRELNDFLKSHPLLNSFPFLSEMACFEWDFKNIFHAPHESGLDSHALYKVLECETALVKLIGPVQLASYHFQIQELCALKNKKRRELLSFNSPEQLIIFKTNQVVRTRIITKNQFTILCKLKSPCSLNQVIQDAPEDTTPEEIQELFEFLTKEHLLKD
ncbi:MAG: putative DNA-binding domain-containing protein [Bacteriovorax sp.]|nr:putative DNA-binding domain-containing protein [Bacteriovorax sp.]